MQTSDFDYNLPDGLIAQFPVEPRDSSKLMVVDRQKKTTNHHHFFDIIDYLKPGDLVVWNNSKVFKARLFGTLTDTEDNQLLDHTRQVEVFLIRAMQNTGVWQVLAKPGKHVRNGMRVRFGHDFYCDIVAKEPTGTILVQFGDLSEEQVRELANKYGRVPLPPYVKDEKHELESYQNTYARPDKEGSVAAPTAGFHFTDELIAKMKTKGVEFAEVTLHVGLGTFLPVKTEKIEDHTMHSEVVEISEETVEKIKKAKAEDRRVIAVGTTTVRTLEGVNHLQGGLQPYHGDLNIFITPGFEFMVVDALITNFHLPKSTLLMLVSAFAGDKDFMLECYKEAIDQNYRFYSFGDAMFII